MSGLDMPVRERPPGRVQRSLLRGAALRGASLIAMLAPGTAMGQQAAPANGGVPVDADPSREPSRAESTASAHIAPVRVAAAGPAGLAFDDSLTLQYWDGGDSDADGTIDGGAGTWDATATNWTTETGTPNAAWGGAVAIFRNPGGLVTVQGSQSVQGIRFMNDGYRLVAGAGGALVLTGAEVVIRVDPGVTAELALPLTGTGNWFKRDSGTLILTGDSSAYDGFTAVTEGTLRIQDGILGGRSGNIGDRPGADGTVIVSGPGRWLNSIQLLVGEEGTGRLRVESGGVVVNPVSYIGDEVGARGEALVTGAGSRWSSGTLLYVGGFGTGLLDVRDGGLVEAPDIYVGFNAGASGRMTVSGADARIAADLLVVGVDGSGEVEVGAGGRIEVEDDLTVGGRAAGELRILAGGQVDSGFGTIGNFATGVGDVLVSGTGARWTIDNLLLVGREGEGSLRIDGGARVDALAAAIGQAAGATGSVTVSGAGSRFVVSGAQGNFTVEIGDFGNGTLLIEDGAVAELYNVRVAGQTGSTGTLTIDGPGSALLLGSSSIFVGRLTTEVVEGGGITYSEGGRGVLNILDGGRMEGGLFVSVGSYEAGSSGHLLVSGPGSLLRTGSVSISGGANGTARIENGGRIETGTFLNDGVAGSAVITGAGSLWLSTRLFGVGGTVTIENGGALRVARLDIGLPCFIECRPGYLPENATVTVTGTGSSVTLSGDTFNIAAPPLGTLNVAAGARLNIGAAGGDAAAAAGSLNAFRLRFQGIGAAIVFNHTDARYLWDTPTSGNGAVLQLAGTTIVTGVHTYSGATTISGGTFLMNGTASSPTVTVAAGAILGGTGTLSGAVSIANGGILAPGDGGAGTLRLGSLALADESILRFNLGTAGVAGGADNDLVNVTGALVLDGRLEVIAAPSFGAGVYRLINYGGALTDNGLQIGSAPTATYTVQTSVAGQVNLVVGNLGPDLSIQFWDGADTAPDGNVDGGAGTWDAATTNWTSANGASNNAWAGNFAVFQNAGGAINVVGAQTVLGLQFMDNGYMLNAGAGGAILLGAAETTVRVDPGVTAEIAAPVTGTGALVKRDSGTLILTGTNSYQGGTTIREGVLQVAGDGALGAASGGVLLDGGTLRFSAAGSSARGFTLGVGGGRIDAADSLTLSGALAGSGTLTKTGAGTLTYSGNGSGYTGTFALSGGALSLSGSLGGTLQVGTGTRLSGTGSLNNLILAGTLAPGNSIGTLTVGGNAVFRADSTLEIEVAAAGDTDLLRVAGTATIEGGTVRVIALDPETQYVDGRNYTFLTAAAGLTGTFTALSETSAFLDFALGYTATSAFVTVEVIRSFPDVALTFNQREASTALAAFGQAAGTDSLAVYNAILMLDEAAARDAFDAASGEIHATALASTLRRGDGLARRLLARSQAETGEGWGLWGGLGVDDWHVAGDGNGARVNGQGFNAEIGVDYRGPNNGWAVGFSTGRHDGALSVRDRASRADLGDWQVGAYARYGDGGAGFTVAASGAWLSGEAETARVIAIGPVARVARGNAAVDALSLGAEVRFGLAAGGGWALGPVARLSYARASLGPIDETGADSLDLAGGGDREHRTTPAVGAFARLVTGRAALDASLVYVAGGGHLTEIELGMGGADTTPFQVRAPREQDSGAQLDISAAIQLGGAWSLGGGLHAAIADGRHRLDASASLRWRF